ncbi:MAG: nitroreductase family protein [Erysipelotrichaceae bacterium]|nr:nitroreductase family protein [Erysipelotrichaceae bacterium]
MEFEQLVKIRRSIRGYREAGISEKELREIFSCVSMAPSWKNSQTGRYYVALGEDAVKEVYDCLPGFNQNSSANAAYIIAAFKKGISGFNNGEATDLSGDIWGGYDLGLQNAYLILKASEMGYDTLIMGLRDEDRLRAYFSIPEDEIIMPVIAIGKRNKDAVEKVRKDADEIMTIR